MSSSEAFVTLVTNDSYALGALVWAKSLRLNGKTSRDIVIMVPKENTTTALSITMREQLAKSADKIMVVDLIDSGDSVNLNLMCRPDLGITFTKLHCWKLTQYTKAVFMDADTLILGEIDDLFQFEELTAVPDPGWPDCFNSGVFVFRPSLETFQSLIKAAIQFGSFDGGDQGLLNQFFADWRTADIRKHLSAVYNCMLQGVYTFGPALRHVGAQIKVLHFIGPKKPWHDVDASSSLVGDFSQARDHSYAGTGLWWSLFRQHVLPALLENKDHLTQASLSQEISRVLSSVGHPNVGSAGQSGHFAAPPGQHSGTDFSERERQFAWERNEIDYTGKDRFENILTRLKTSMETAPSSSSADRLETASVGPPHSSPASQADVANQSRREEDVGQ